MATALATIGSSKNLQEMLEARTDDFRKVLPREMSLERVFRIVSSACVAVPRLKECTPASMLGAVMTSLQLGLEPAGPLGHAYLVPFQRSKKVGDEWQRWYEVQLILGYRGLVKLARDSGEVATVEARCVHANDLFRLEYGLHPALEHTPTINGDPGKLIAVYAIARFTGGSGGDVQFEVMSAAQVEGIRNRSKVKSEQGPWTTDYEEMARKTVVRRLAKMLPLSIKAADAIAQDDAAEFGDGNGVVSLPAEDEVRPPVSRTQALKGRLAPPKPPPEEPSENEDYPEQEDPGPPDNLALDQEIAAQQEMEYAPRPAQRQEPQQQARRQSSRRTWQ